MIDYRITVGLGIDLNRELSFLNLCTYHAVLHKLDRKRLAFRMENLHLLRALRNVTESMVSDTIKKMTDVAQWHNLLVKSS